MEFRFKQLVIKQIQIVKHIKVELRMKVIKHIELIKLVGLQLVQQLLSEQRFEIFELVNNQRIIQLFIMGHIQL